MFSNRGKNPGAVKFWSQDVSGSVKFWSQDVSYVMAKYSNLGLQLYKEVSPSSSYT